METRAASRRCSRDTLRPCPEVLADQELGWFGLDLGLSMAGVLIPMSRLDGIGVSRRRRAQEIVCHPCDVNKK